MRARYPVFLKTFPKLLGFSIPQWGIIFLSVVFFSLFRVAEYLLIPLMLASAITILVYKRIVPPKYFYLLPHKRSALYWETNKRKGNEKL